MRCNPTSKSSELIPKKKKKAKPSPQAEFQLLESGLSHLKHYLLRYEKPKTNKKKIANEAQQGTL